MKRSIIAAAISLLFLAVASFAEVAGERPVSEPAYGPAPGTRYGSAAASDGHDFLVAWIDSFRNPASAKRVYAARMNASGEVLDLLGIRLPTTNPQISRVDVVFLGNSYLVYWDEPISLNHNAIMGARISRDGVLLDATARVLADGATVNIHGAASNGNRTVIAYITSGDSRMIVLDRDGNVVSGPKPFTSPAAPAASESSMVASNGSEFLVMSIRGAVLYPARLDSNGDVTSTSVVSTTTATSLLDLASDGDGYVAVTQAPTGIAAQHVSASAQLLEKWPVPMQEIIPGFAFAGGSYLLMDGDPVAGTVGVRRMDRTGQPLGSYVVVSSAQALGGGATLASNGADAAVFWTDSTTTVQSFLGALVNGQSLAASKTSPIARSANAQRAPNTATSGRNTAIVWNEDDGLYAGRISLDGQTLDGRGIRIGPKSLTEPRIVYDGNNYLIAWVEQPPSSSTPVDTVKLSRLSDTGALLDPSGIAISASQCLNGVTLAAGAAATLLAWSDCQRIVATTVGRDGSIASAVTVTPAQTTNAGSVSAAWNGHEWLVAWEDEVRQAFSWDPPIAYDVRILASRLSPSLTILDPGPIVISNTLRDSLPQVASDGEGFLVVWTNYLAADVSTYQVMAQRISSDGSLLAQANGTRIADGTAKSVVWDGAEYDVALSTRSSSGTVPAYTYTLYVTHVAAAGAIEGLRPLSVVMSAIEPYASLVVTGTGRTATVYTRLGSEQQYGDVERAFVSVPHVLRGRAAR
jgi:hypothetical protein